APQVSLAAAPQAATQATESSAEAPAADARSPNVADATAPAAEAAEGSTVEAAPADAATDYTPLGPEWIKGAPESGALTFQEQFSADRSEEHTSELQSRENLVCRLLLETKKPLGVAA